jgi:cytochrome c-type biogenesis protein CcmH/NrfG
VRPNLVAAAVAQRRGRLLEARGELLEAVDEQPQSAQSWAALSALALDLADRDGALAAARRALSLDPHAAELLALAQRAETAQAPPSASPTATGTPLPSFVVP